MSVKRPLLKQQNGQKQPKEQWHKAYFWLPYNIGIIGDLVKKKKKKRKKEKEKSYLIKFLRITQVHTHKNINENT